jgi:FkbM family methyltransferase
MRFNVNILFYFFLERFHLDIVCDVGSRDGVHSLKFRNLLPNARIIAFEANPHNYDAMRSDQKLAQNKIEIVHKAVTNRAGRLTFHVLQLENGVEEAWRTGGSSVHNRTDGLPTVPVEVESIRLDEFIESLDRAPQSVALWIDVEGAAYEVLEGIERIASRVQVLHVEVEAKETWAGQKVVTDIDALLKRLGFCFAGRGYGYQDIQYDVVYINRRTFKHSRLKVMWIIGLAVLVTYLERFGGSAYHRLKSGYLKSRSGGK